MKLTIVRFAIFFVSILVITSCLKDSADDLSGDENVIGRLFLSDPLAGGDPVAQAKKKVTIKYSDSADPLNYLFSVITDDNGYFKFSNLKPGRRYTVSYSEIIGGILYEASLDVDAPTNMAVLTAELAGEKQRGIIFQVKDYSQNIIKGADICIYTSATSSGYILGNCDGSIYKLTTNELGRSKLFGIANGTYYATANVTVNQTLLTAKAMVTVADSVSTVNIELVKPNGLVVRLKDYSGNIVKGGNVCLFTSSGAAGYLSGTCEGSVLNGTSDASGTVNFGPLKPGDYYIVSTVTVDGVPLNVKAKVTVGTDQSSADLVLNKPNGIRFVTTDANGERIGNASICVFTSSILFNNGSCDGSNFQLSTGTNGSFEKYALDKGTYYILGSKIVGKDTLIAKSTVSVNDNIADCILRLIKK